VRHWAQSVSQPARKNRRAPNDTVVGRARLGGDGAPRTSTRYNRPWSVAGSPGDPLSRTPSSRFQLTYFDQAFADVGMRVVTIDRPGLRRLLIPARTSPRELAHRRRRRAAEPRSRSVTGAPSSPATSRNGPNGRGELSESHIPHSGNVLAEARLDPDPQQDGLAHLPGEEHHRPRPGHGPTGAAVVHIQRTLPLPQSYVGRVGVPRREGHRPPARAGLCGKHHEQRVLPD
jgi:hypothetical protein